MHLPSEILSQIYSYLPKSSLKAVRLACRILYETATPLLFNSIFISARYVDYEVANLVAFRFSTSIKTLKLSSECYYPLTWPDYRNASKLRPILCKKPALHRKTAKRSWNLYCQLRSERQVLYKTGALNAQLSILLTMLTNLHQIIIADRRRRQHLSWTQEALMGEKKQRISLPVSHTALLSRVRRGLADLLNFRKWSDSRMTFKDLWTWFRPSSKIEKMQALRPWEKIQHKYCGCFDGEPPIPRWIFNARSRYTTQNPWADIMEALGTRSNDVSIRTISIQAKDTNCYLPLIALELCDPFVSLPTTRILAHLTKLELCMDFKDKNDHRLSEITRELRLSTKMLSTASNLQSLVIDFMGFHRDPLFFATDDLSLTAFGAFLGGCQLPQLLTLHLCKLTFWENEFSAFLQHSPGLRDLSLQSFDMVEQGEDRQLMYADPRSWERLFDSMKQALPRLERFHLSNSQLYEDQRRWRKWSGKVSNMMIQQFMFDDGMNPFMDIQDHGDQAHITNIVLH